MAIKIRRANIEDAEGIVNIINSVVEEGKYTSLRKFSAEEERKYVASLNHRESIFVAIENGNIVGFQSIDLFAKWSESMDHVGSILTMVLKTYRGRGIGKALAENTLEFARQNNYEKICTYIMADNVTAINYYKSIGFTPVGMWSRQVKINNIYHDNIIVELFL